MESTYLNRRSLVIAAASLTVAATHSYRFALGQDASPGTASHDHGDGPSRPAPELVWDVTDDTITAPGDVRAGLNRVTLNNQTSADINILTVSVPPGISVDEVLAIALDPEAPVPDWIAESWLPGIPNNPAPGESVTGYAFYYPGTYVAFNIFGAAATTFTVEGDPWGVPAPASDVRVGMVEMAFLGIEGPIAAGPQTWEVVNHGATWHEIVLLTTPELWTPEEVLELIMTTDEPPDGVGFLNGAGITSPGGTVWLDLDLAPGAYAAVCFAPDNFTGPPHAVLGMISTFEVV